MCKAIHHENNVPVHDVCLKVVMEIYVKELEFKSSVRRRVKANFGPYRQDSWQRHAMKKLEGLDTESPQPNNDTPKSTSCPRKPSLDCSN